MKNRTKHILSLSGYLVLFLTVAAIITVAIFVYAAAEERFGDNKGMIALVMLIAVFFLALVCTLLIYFPLGKLMHAVGVFMSPTRNMVNNSRAKRHVNPWNPVVEFHYYEDYEDEFREKMVKVGLPVDKTIEEAAAEKAAKEASLKAELGI